MDWHIRVGLVPADHVGCVAMVDEINQNVVSKHRFLLKKLGAQQRRRNVELLFWQIFDSRIRESHAGGPGSSQSYKLAHERFLQKESARAEVLRMFHHELMAHGNYRRGTATEQLEKSGQRFEKVDDQVGPRLSNEFLKRVKASLELVERPQCADRRARKRDAFVRLEYESGALSLNDGRIKRGGKEVRQAPILILADQDADDLVRVAR